MFTNKETKEFLEYIKTAKLNKVEFPELNFPRWLPLGVKQQVLGYAKMINRNSDNENARLFFDSYAYQVEMFERILPLYMDDSMKEMWSNLNKISKEKTISFAGCFFMIENGFDGAVAMCLKHRNEKECFNRLLKQVTKLKDIMEEYSCHYYGHMITDEFNKLEELLPLFQEKSIKELEDFKKETKDISYLVSDICPVTREFQNETALQIFFIRKISSAFRDVFKKPFNKYVADIINLIFLTSYIDNDIIKITKYKTKNENSSPKK